jgi:DNA-binding CsgD family transcriptional regulator
MRLNLKNITLKDLILIGMLVIVIVINTTDFLKDILHGDEWLHISLEVITVFLSLWGIVMLIQQINNRSQEISKLNKKIEKSEQDLALSHTKLKEIGREYSVYLHKQFEDWNLTPSEKDVALILLKGLSFKEMAEVRNTKEKTIRQQASTIYKKSNVAGRHEFSAWFFEDMLV